MRSDEWLLKLIWGHACAPTVTVPTVSVAVASITWPTRSTLNLRRRDALADAAIEILGTGGIHKLSHRAVDEQAGLPQGIASNYFPRRDDLLAAAASRISPADAFTHEGALALARCIVTGVLADKKEVRR